MALEEKVSHAFHIPVLGLGFSIDTPLKVSHFGFDSVMALTEDNIIEMMRRYHAEQHHNAYVPIRRNEHDARARRITAYLNLIKELADENFETLRSLSFDDPENDLNQTFQLLAPDHHIRRLYDRFCQGETGLEPLLRNSLRQGSLDVNIMTKLDHPHARDRTKYANEAMAALRGFANSDLESSIVLSAGFNDQLFSYLGELDAFRPGHDGFRKKVILKVSDYGSARTQALRLAQKGVWVSEFRVESGLNCGGHAFANRTGDLIGPILDEFQQSREGLHEMLLAEYRKAIGDAGFSTSRARLTYQGGIKTHEELALFKEVYGVDGVGMGTPFLFVPEVTNVSPYNLDLLIAATKDDLVLSEASPLGVPFWMLLGTEGLQQHEARIAAGRPGVVCTYAKLLSPYGESFMCAADSRRMQEELAALAPMAEGDEKEYRTFVVLAKNCLCPGLSRDVQDKHGLEDGFREHAASVVCAGPSAQYFHRSYTLKEMVHRFTGEEPGETLPFTQMDEIGINLRKNEYDLANHLFRKNPEKELQAIKRRLGGIQRSIDYYHEHIGHFAPRQEEVVGQLQQYQQLLDRIRADHLPA
ncbi:MAG: hypothetical protein GXP63_03880 [DPANN group archaeon]|nr:hypothetical protein [DPANN group archaeon]